MKKNLRYFMTLLLVMVASVGWAETYTLGWGTATGEEGTYSNFTTASGSVDGIISFATDKNSAQNAPAYNSSNSELRLYYSSNGNGGSITLTPANGVTITGFVMTTTTSPSVEYTVDEGTATSISASNNTYTVTDISASSSLKIQNVNTSNTQLRIKTIEITYTSSGATQTCATPTFDPPAGAVAEGTKVTISCTTEGATIHYTTNGDNPSEESSTYSSSNPIVVSEGMTIKAIAVKSGMENSDIASAAYTVYQPVSGYTIDFEKPLNAYVDWEFENIGIHTGTIDAHGDSSYGANVNESGNGVASAFIKTKEKVANPTTFTCYVSKETTNTTASTWSVEVSSDGSSWTKVKSQSASSMGKGIWTEITANLGTYSNVYVGLSYEGSTAIRAVDDISIVEGGKMTADVTISSTQINIGETATVSTDENAPAITITTSDAAIASVDGTTVKGVAAGTATIKAKWEEDDNYNGGEKEFTITVVDPNGPGTENNPFTVAQALEIINGLEDGKTTSDAYFVKGFVVGTPDFQRNNDGILYGNCNFNIADSKGGTTTLTIFRGKSFNNSIFTEEDVAAPILKEGDGVVLTGKLQKYVKNEEMTPQLTNGYLFSVNVTITSCGYATLISNHALDFSKAGGATAYIVKDNDISDNAITLTPVTKVPANTGLVIAGTAGETYSIPAISDETDDVDGNLMVGNANEDIPIDANQGYILAASDGLFHPCSGGTLAKGKAYLAVAVPTPTPGEAKNLTIVFGEGTGINNVNVNENESGKIFNLAGQQMKSAVKGVYIKNGKKYIK